MKGILLFFTLFFLITSSGCANIDDVNEREQQSTNSPTMTISPVPTEPCSPAISSTPVENYVVDEIIELHLRMNGDWFYDEKQMGRYTGTLNADGMPEGEGVFVCLTTEYTETKGSKPIIQEKYWTYKGMFVNGHLEGQGELSFRDGTAKVQKGLFVNDIPPKTIDVLYNEQGHTAVFGEYWLDTRTADYIYTHSPSLFPIAESVEIIESEDIQKFEAKEFKKIGTQEIKGIIKLSLKATTVLEGDWLGLMEGDVGTAILARDESNNVYAIYYNGLSNILNDDSFIVYGLPVGTSSFDETNGETIVAIVIIGCCVVKQ